MWAMRTCESRTRRARLLALVPLAGAVVVAGCTASPAHPAATASPGSTATPASAVSGCLAPPAGCYPPRLFDVAYGIQPLLNEGIDGRSETVTFLEPNVLAGSPASAGPSAGPPPASISQDLAAFDIQFRLPAARVKIVTSLAGAASPLQASEEEVQDLEIVHAIAPAATLRVVLVPSSVQETAVDATAGMLAGLRLAVSGTDVAMIGWSLGEHFFTGAQAAQMHSILLGAQARHVTVIASSGDNGGFSDATFGGTPVKEVSLPAADPLVLSVGGTTLTANSVTGAYTSEAVWNGQAGFSVSNGASGGGFSHLYARPSYQDGVPGTSAMRGVPDVAGDADDASGFSMVSASGNQTAIQGAGGTDAAASLWAGVIALADQYAHHDIGFVNPAIYSIARSSSYHRAFNDVTTGSNIQTLPYPAGTAGYKAGPGWDPVTGWGSPNAHVLVPLLAA